MGFYTETGLLKIARLIYSARKRRNLSLRQFAKLCEVNQATISRLEMGEFDEPTNDSLNKIAPYLGLSIIDLILIGSEQEELANKPLKKAEDILALLGDLPIEELKRLRDIINERLSSVEELERGLH